MRRARSIGLKLPVPASAAPVFAWALCSGLWLVGFWVIALSFAGFFGLGVASDGGLHFGVGLARAATGEAPGQTLAKVEESDDRPHVTFVGFQPLQGGGGRIFVHLTGSPSRVESSQSDKRAVISLSDIGIGARNNKYPLDLENFALPVTRVELEARGSTVDVELSLRREIALNPRLQKRPDGAVVLELEIPAP